MSSSLSPSSSSSSSPDTQSPSAHTAGTSSPLIIVGACFHELKARALAATDGAIPEAGSVSTSPPAPPLSRGNRREAHGTTHRTAHGGTNLTRERTEASGRSGGETSSAQEAEVVDTNSSGSSLLLSSLPWVVSLVNRPEGFLVEAEGVVIRAEHDEELGKKLDSLGRQVRGLVAAQAGLPGRFVFIVGWLVRWLVRLSTTVLVNSPPLPFSRVSWFP